MLGPAFYLYKSGITFLGKHHSLIMDGPSTSTSNSEKENNLELAQNKFQKTTKTQQLTTTVKVRRRNRGLRHVAQDLLFTIEFGESSAGNLPLLDVLLGIYQSLLVLIRQLKIFFNDKKRRLVFFSADMNIMTSPIFSGARNLWMEKEREIVSSILQPLFAYLTSNAEVDLRAGLEVKTCVLSLAHTLEYDQKRVKRRALKRPPPDDLLVGHRGSSLKSIDFYSGKHHGLILVPKGVPDNERLFENRCLPVAFCIGKKIYQAAYQGEAAAKKVLDELRGLCQRVNVSKKKKECYRP